MDMAWPISTKELFPKKKKEKKATLKNGRKSEIHSLFKAA